ncbi:hypothetical protein AMATHDRAFT_84518 [Amanita thiersii Skay4041]|uniref:Uncharacterized protein n=1 Tax=Amanita thiersii Skay4041 TaxID=703135 RepID=A0A2A9NQN8_9AGAR|nr:hypothetical protein AMATHDRAFT_84518 [Amanita thiersii Skay4041]
MIDMEIDLQSSSHQPTSNAVKRARSPDPTSPALRPLKRPVLGLNAPSSLSSFGYHHTNLVSVEVGSSQSEDWVSQARSLSIESPSPADGLSTVGEGVERDTDMEQDEKLESLPTTPPSLCESDISIPQSYIPDADYRRLGYRKASSAPPLDSTPSVSQSHLLLESTDVKGRSSASPGPSTLMTTRCGPDQGEMEGDSSMCMVVSPTTPSFVIPVPSQVDIPKPRFSMGPRGDCELCRQGVKGHSVHWNS